jgi:DNA-binding CsgD family transcriptional regulator
MEGDGETPVGEAPQVELPVAFPRPLEEGLPTSTIGKRNAEPLVRFAGRRAQPPQDAFGALEYLSERECGGCALRLAWQHLEPHLKELATAIAVAQPQSTWVPRAPDMSAARIRPPLDQLTRRQGEVASLLADGRSDREIATELGVRLSTARSHTTAVLAKLGAHSRRQVRAIGRDGDPVDKGSVVPNVRFAAPAGLSVAIDQLAPSALGLPGGPEHPA